MAQANKWLDWLWDAEGGNAGLVNVPGDNGSWTNAGITIATWQRLAPALLGIAGTLQTLGAMTRNQWRVIALWFWDRYGGNAIRNQRVATHVVDSVWGSGAWGAMRVQRVLNRDFGKELAVDGVIGPLTIAAINSVPNQNLLYHKLVEERKRHMHEIVQADPVQAKFLKGWLNRINELTSILSPAGTAGAAILVAGLGFLGWHIFF